MKTLKIKYRTSLLIIDTSGASGSISMYRVSWSKLTKFWDIYYRRVVHDAFSILGPTNSSEDLSMLHSRGAHDLERGLYCYFVFFL